MNLTLAGALLHAADLARERRRRYRFRPPAPLSMAPGAGRAAPMGRSAVALRNAACFADGSAPKVCGLGAEGLASHAASAASTASVLVSPRDSAARSTAETVSVSSFSPICLRI